ncbi:MAG: hypothetical protein WD992_00855, partial [Candidatus Levyibacteriota bacterium]
MRHKHFYSHIVDTTSISIEIADMNLTSDERVHLLSLAESNIHHAVLDTILSELPEDDKKEFLKHVKDDSHDKIWDLLKDKVENIEGKIKKAAEDIKAELHKDIEEV